MVLLPLIRSRTDVPIIAAGGITDGATMAAAFMLGADGVQMGTRMMSSAESPIHQNWKQAVIEAGDTGTVFLNQQSRPALRALRTERTMNLYETGPFTSWSIWQATMRSTLAAIWRRPFHLRGKCAGGSTVCVRCATSFMKP